jgi:voltage-gated potassium channel
MIFLQKTGAAVLLVLITLTIQCGGAAALIIWIRSIPRETREVRVFRCAALVMQTTVAVIILHGIVILLWASCYRWLCLPSWESAFYFSASSYATVGYGDVVLPSKWRLLGPLESMVGMLMAGVSIGLLFAAVTHLVDGESRSRLQRHAEPPRADAIRIRQRRRCYLRGFRSDVSLP